MGLVGFAAFQAQTRMSTIPLLPPDRSHICIAFASELCAQALAGSGVGAAAAALADASVLGEAASLADAAALAGALAADAAGAEAAGAVAAEAAADPPVDAAGPDVPLHAANRKTPTNARAGNLRRLLIPCSSTLRTDRTAAIAPLVKSGGRYTSTNAIEWTHSFAAILRAKPATQW